MLHKLSIRNYAIIDKLEIEFNERMNIITGETGAGKSILVGALGLILGERADTKVLYSQGEKCIVEADFDITGYSLKNFFRQNELDFEVHTIVRREISQNGKSRAFVNDTPVTLNVLKELGEKLVNLHSQHETLELTNAGFQLNVVDILARNQKLLSDYQLQFEAYKKLHRELSELADQNKTASAELDYLNFQLKEFTEAKLQAGEQQPLEEEHNALSNVEEIKRSLQNAVQILSESELSVLQQLNEIQSRLKGVKNFSKEISAFTVRIQSAQEELKDVSRELDSIQENTSLNPERLEEVNARLNTIYRLQKKNNAATVEELLNIQNEIEGRINSAGDNSNRIEELKKILEKQFKELLAVAEQLHASREKILRGFQNNISVLLTKVGMPNASFKVEIKKIEPHQLNDNGVTEVRFLFSANKGFTPLEIKDVASGGELSRLMLCIKSLIADSSSLPTMVFDEIDSGISGEVALKVGEIMKNLSRNHQLISVTHLPQIARTADKHLFIFKETSGAKTQMRMKALNGEERVFEIAKMLSGEKITDGALANARELVAM